VSQFAISTALCPLSQIVTKCATTRPKLLLYSGHNSQFTNRKSFCCCQQNVSTAYTFQFVCALSPVRENRTTRYFRTVNSTFHRVCGARTAPLRSQTVTSNGGGVRNRTAVLRPGTPQSNQSMPFTPIADSGGMHPVPRCPLPMRTHLQ